MEYIHRIFQIISTKYSLHEKTLGTQNSKKEWLSPERYVGEIHKEIEEMQDEMHENNNVYLEDELGDIFWDYMNLLETLERKWYINKEKVFERCEKKFEERVDALSQEISWDTIKQKQKSDLLSEHNTLYND